MAESPLRPIGSYTIFEEIGHGAFAIVYRAENTALQKIVAIKLLNPAQFNDPEIAERFLQEARQLAALRHERIVSVLDLEQDANRLYLVLEYMPGGDLQTKKGGTPHRLGFRRIAEVVADIAEALDFAHEQSLTHGDVKPANILLAQDGHAKLADFGLLQVVEKSTQTSTLAGTAFYLSPEQVSGHAPTPLSDQYALGAVVYELLTGQPPFSGETTQAVYMKHLREEPRPPSQLSKLVTPTLDSVVLKALSKEPEARYASCGEFAHELRAAVAQTEQQQFQVNLNAAQAALAAHDLAAARTTLDEALLIVPDDKTARDLLERLDTQTRAQSSYADAVTHLLAARERASLLCAVQPNHDDPKDILTRLIPPPPSKRVAPQQWRSTIWLASLVGVLGILAGICRTIYAGIPYYGQIYKATLVAIVRTPIPPISIPSSTATPSPTSPPTATPSPTSPPTATPSSTSTPPPTATPTSTPIGGAPLIIFYSHRDGHPQIYMMNTKGNNQTRLTNNSARDGSPAWSPNGKQIVFDSNRDGHYQIYVMDTDGSNQTRLTNSSVDESLPAWSPDGTQIAFDSSRDGNWEIYVMDVDGSNQTRLTNNSADDYSSAWSPDGTQIAFHSNRDGNWEIYVMDADGSNQTRLTNNKLANDEFPAWSPDGTQISFVSNRIGNSEIYVMDADGSNQTRLTNNSAKDYLPSWSPDGTKIGFYSDRDGNSEIYVMDADGRNQTRLTNNTYQDLDPAWSPK